MLRRKMLLHMENYLKTHNIPYTKEIDNGYDRLTMVYKDCELCPDKILESCIWFYPDALEARVYYDENASSWCKQSKNIDKLMRLLNFINAKLWCQVSDGMSGLLYKSKPLHTSRLYMTEDGCCDITLTTVVNYEVYELAPLETEDYLTAACPELMNDLSPSIFGIVNGTLDLDLVCKHIERIAK